MTVRELKALLTGVDDDLEVEVMVYDAYQAASRKDPDYTFKKIESADSVFGRFLLS